MLNQNRPWALVSAISYGYETLFLDNALSKIPSVE